MTTGRILDGKKLVLISIMRAGAGLLDGMLRVLPSARVGHVGLYRDARTLAAVEYYFKMPQAMSERDAIVVDPMLATGHSAVAAVDRLRETRPRSIKFVCLVTCPEGLAHFHGRHPDVPGLHRGRRQPPRQPRLHRARSGRCGRPHLRNEVGAAHEVSSYRSSSQRRLPHHQGQPRPAASTRRMAAARASRRTASRSSVRTIRCSTTTCPSTTTRSTHSGTAE